MGAVADLRYGAMKGVYFSVEGKKELHKHRWARIKNLNRIPLSMVADIFALYLKKFFGLKGTTHQNASNYYFLTLINCDAYSQEINSTYYIFRRKDGIRFAARKHPSSDLEVFNQVWGRDEYIKATRLLDAQSKERKTIVDAGANVGYTALFFNYKFPGSKIIAIEPDDANLSVLKKNIELNQADNIIPQKMGIWSHKCYLEVDKSFRDNREWSFQVKESELPTGLMGNSLDGILTDNHIDRIDLLKVDIEGAERHLFDDPAVSKKFLDQTEVLAIEIHEEELSREKVYTALSRNGFSFINHSDLTIASRQ